MLVEKSKNVLIIDFLIPVLRLGLKSKIVCSDPLYKAQIYDGEKNIKSQGNLK